jgi:hypothetical protein
VARQEYRQERRLVRGHERKNANWRSQSEQRVFQNSRGRTLHESPNEAGDDDEGKQGRANELPQFATMGGSPMIDKVDMRDFSECPKSK